MFKLIHIIWTFPLLFSLGCSEIVATPTELIGTRLPELKLYIGDGKKTIEMGSLLKGKSTLLLFVSTDCSTCRKLTQKILDNIKKFENKQIIIVTTSKDAKYIAFKKDYKLDAYPNVVAGIDKDNILLKNYKIESVPYLIVIREDKTIARVFTSGSNFEEIYEI
ncbi:MAG: hypothetical protein DI539_16580 [Flavobacterium psychrophilum]|nr:MAG: hypothetical protein DI539_16580 [Flavobacterium psychrophilum]